MIESDQNVRQYPWVFECLKRDGGKCTKCGGVDQLLVHHIDGSRRTGKLNNEMSNLLTLCRKCHSIVHGQKRENMENDVVEMREAGFSFREIGEKYGYSRQRAHWLYQKGLDT